MKFALIGIGFVVSLILLIAVGVTQSGGMHYYVTVSEFLQENSDSPGLRVNGKSVTNIIELVVLDGQEVTLETCGPDQDEALKTLGDFLTNVADEMEASAAPRPETADGGAHASRPSTGT